MELQEAMRTQRAVRRLRTDPVNDEVLLRCAELALRAPTGGNRQAVELVFVRDRRIKWVLQRQYRKAWGVYGGLGRLLRGSDPAARKIIDAVQWQVDHLLRSSRYGSVYPAVQNFLLAARAEGLGAALTTLALWNPWAVRRTLGLPWNVEPVAMIPVGWPHGRYGPITRRPVERSVHVDRYGNRPFLEHASGR